MNLSNASRGDVPAEQQQDQGRSLAEWITLGISLMVLLVLLGFVTYAYFARDYQPAVIEIRPQLQALRQDVNTYYLPIDIINSGGQTAENVWVEISLIPHQGQPESTEFIIQFLSGGEVAQATAVFRTDPRQGDLTSTVSFLKP